MACSPIDLPTYEESLQPSTNDKQQEPIVHNLRVFIRFSEIAHKDLLQDFDPSKLVHLVSVAIPFHTILTSTSELGAAKLGAVDGNLIDYTIPENNLVTIDFECDDLPKLMNIRDHLLRKHLKESDVLCSNVINLCSDTITAFQQDLENDKYFIKVKVERCSMYGRRQLVVDKAPSGSHTYSLLVNYRIASLVFTKRGGPPRNYFWSTRQPISSVIKCGSTVLDYKCFGNEPKEVGLTVIYKTDNLTKAKHMCKCLTRLDFYGNTEKSFMTENMGYHFNYVFLEETRLCKPKNPLKVEFDDTDICFRFSSYVQIDCYSHPANCIKTP